MKIIKKRAKALLGLVLLPCLILCLCACGEKEPYQLWQVDSQIERIEIVDICGETKEPLYYESLVTIQNHESFLNKFYQIPFGKVRFGDPNGPYGPSLCIKYKNGEYELIDASGQYIVLNEETNDWYFGRRYCDAEEFLALLTYFGYVG